MNKKYFLNLGVPKSERLDSGYKERTIMLIGATGTGKSTLVDGIVNYVMGVSWKDPFRFRVVNLEEEERGRLKNQVRYLEGPHFKLSFVF